MNADDELEETEIDGFDSDTQTLFCHNAIHDQLVQVRVITFGSSHWNLMKAKQLYLQHCVIANDVIFQTTIWGVMFVI